MKKRLYVDFHVLQTVPPSCINRDDTGSPKTAIYGGASYPTCANISTLYQYPLTSMESERL